MIPGQARKRVRARPKCVVRGLRPEMIAMLAALDGKSLHDVAVGLSDMPYPFRLTLEDAGFIMLCTTQRGQTERMVIRIHETMFELIRLAAQMAEPRDVDADHEEAAHSG